jgi:putative SOS response-associated peptidase YedK
MCVLREATGTPITIQSVRWGLVPGWSDDLSVGVRMINARGETVDSKPSFRRAFASRRCLIPADGFYEWKKMPAGKQPFLIEPTHGGVMAMAGLWEDNVKLGTQDAPLRTFCIITTAANRTMAPLHERMPVILSSQHFDSWLDPGYRDAAALKPLLVPAPDDSLRLTAVSTRVNSPKHDDIECVEPIERSDS